MRVTKIIREYVEKRVKEIYGEPTEVEKEYERAKAEFEDNLKKANEEIKTVIKEYMAKIPNPYGFELEMTSSHIFNNYSWHYETPEIEKKYKKARDERLKKQSDALENIFVTLELGGNKEQLEQMLADLK